MLISTGASGAQPAKGVITIALASCSARNEISGYPSACPKSPPLKMWSGIASWRKVMRSLNFA
jgi:hypothetical protein